MQSYYSTPAIHSVEPVLCRGTQAELYRVRREYAKAEPLYLEAVGRMKAALGPESYR